MSELSLLSPQPLWDIFAKICSIPHPSYHEEALAKYVVGWAKEQGFWVERDQVGSILIRKPATAGMENRTPVALQAHLDMVPQKNNDTVHDFTKDPIQPYVDGKWVKAHGTMLGADNGIGMASALAVLTENSLTHGPLEVLLTITEESGMEGAVDFITTLPLQREAVPANFETLKLTLKGLKGGHSGADIHLGLGNANKLLARFFAAHAAELDIRLIEFTGGMLRNAIPREAFATLAIDSHKVDALKSAAAHFQTTLQNQLGIKEKNLIVLSESLAHQGQALAADSRDRFINLLNSTPNGVIRNSDVASGDHLPDPFTDRHR